MKKTLFGLAAVAIVGLATLPANADVVYINSDGSMSTLGTSSVMTVPTTTTQIITQPAVIDPVLTTPTVVQPTVISEPVMIERRHRQHLLNVGLPGLFGVHLF
jgi:hypothetical protein